MVWSLQKWLGIQPNPLQKLSAKVLQPTKLSSNAGAQGRCATALGVAAVGVVPDPAKRAPWPVVKLAFLDFAAYRTRFQAGPPNVGSVPTIT